MIVSFNIQKIEILIRLLKKRRERERDTKSNKLEAVDPNNRLGTPLSENMSKFGQFPWEESTISSWDKWDIRL